MQLTKDIRTQMLRPALTGIVHTTYLWGWAKIIDTTYLWGWAKHSDSYILVVFHKLSPECFAPTEFQ